jgi:hypothetical protein
MYPTAGKKGLFSCKRSTSFGSRPLLDFPSPLDNFNMDFEDIPAAEDEPQQVSNAMPEPECEEDALT